MIFFRYIIHIIRPLPEYTAKIFFIMADYLLSSNCVVWRSNVLYLVEFSIQTLFTRLNLGAHGFVCSCSLNDFIIYYLELKPAEAFSSWLRFFFWQCALYISSHFKLLICPNQIDKQQLRALRCKYFECHAKPCLSISRRSIEMCHSIRTKLAHLYIGDACCHISM